MQHKSPFRDKVRIIVFDNNFILVMKLSRNSHPSLFIHLLLSQKIIEGTRAVRGGGVGSLLSRFALASLSLSFHIIE